MGHWDAGTLIIGQNFFFQNPWTTSAMYYQLTHALTIDDRIMVFTSKRAWKENIQSIPDELIDEAFNLRPVTYLPLAGPDLDHAEPMEHETMGFISEEVHDVVPEGVILDKEGAPGSINEIVVLALAVGMCKRLKARVDELEARLAALEGA